MRYFTKQLWRGAQVPGSDDANVRAWQAAAAEYRQQLERLQPRLSADAFQFFSAADVHDAELMSLEIRDGSRPALRSAPARPWGSSRPDPVSVHLSVLDAEKRILWNLRYTSVRRARVDFPGDDPLFHAAGSGFGERMGRSVEAVADYRRALDAARAAGDSAAADRLARKVRPGSH